MINIKFHVTFHEGGITIYSQDDVDITWTFLQTFPEVKPEQVLRTCGIGSSFRIQIPIIATPTAPITKVMAEKNQQFNSNVTTLPSEDVVPSDRHE